MKALVAVAIAFPLIAASPIHPYVKAGTGAGSEPQVYPVRFHMVHVHYGGRITGNSDHGEGQANVSEDGQPTRGYDFVFTNCLPFTEGKDYGEGKKFPHELPGRWTSKDHFQLVLLRTDLGATPDGRNREECTLHGFPKDFKYVHQNGKLAAAPLDTVAPEK